MEDHIDCPCVILNVEPVTHILPFSIDRKRTTLTDVIDEQWYKLLRKLVRPVIVRAVGHNCRHPVSVMIGTDKMVTGSLCRRIRTVRLVLALLREERVAERPAATLVAGRITLRPGQLKSAVDLICGDVVEPLPIPAFRLPELTCGLKKRQRAKHIGPGERERIHDRPVHMALGGKMDDTIDGIFTDHLAHRLQVADVSLDEDIVRFILYILEIGEVTRIGKFVEVDDPVVRVLVDEKPHDMTADEAGTAGNQDRPGVVRTHIHIVVRKITSAYFFCIFRSCRSSKASRFRKMSIAV